MKTAAPSAPSRAGAPALAPLRRDPLSSVAPLTIARRARTLDGQASDPALALSARRPDNGSVRVVVRCRPLNVQERTRGDVNLFRISPKQTRELQVVSGSGHGRELVRSFQFDFCASEELSQVHFFRSCGVVTLLDAVAQGYMATIFAYGQTGSGKTYSMSGLSELMAVTGNNASPSKKRSVQSPEVSDAAADGLIPRSLKHLFAAFEAAPKDVRFVVRASCCEIYNEQVFDLLNPSSGSLNIRWTDRRGFYVQNLLVVQCDSLDDVLAVVHESHRNRRVAAHAMNSDSSRSHAILTVHVDRETTDPNDGHVVTRYGKVSFVDLAGSERLKETRSSNTEETTNINKSLLTLGKVISALAAKAAANFIPYRDSKLTKLLMDSLGGNSLTLMLACVSPSPNALEDTLSTLNYATRAKNIQNKPTVQVDPMEFALSNLRKQNHLLKGENEALRMRLRALGGSSPLQRMPSLTSIPSSSHFLPPLHGIPSDRSPAKKQSPQDEDGGGAVRNQLLALQEDNDQLLQYAKTSDQKMRQLKVENEALQAKLAGAGQMNQQHTTGDAAAVVERLKLQVQQLQTREQELMQALVSDLVPP